MQAAVSQMDLGEWQSMQDYLPIFYYKEGEPASIPKESVFSSNSGFKIAKEVRPRRDGDIIELYVDLTDLCILSHFNYLIAVDSDDGSRFVMLNTADEKSMQPILVKE
jgi:hypothetical protein